MRPQKSKCPVCGKNDAWDWHETLMGFLIFVAFLLAIGAFVKYIFF